MLFVAVLGYSPLGAVLVSDAVAEVLGKVVAIAARPSHHVGPGKKHRYFNSFVSGIFRMPSIYGNGIAGFAVIFWKYGRELLERDVRRKFIPAIVVPGFWIKRIVIARAEGIVPLPVR